MAEEEERLAKGFDQAGVHLRREKLWRTGRDTELAESTIYSQKEKLLFSENMNKDGSKDI